MIEPNTPCCVVVRLYPMSMSTLTLQPRVIMPAPPHASPPQAKSQTGADKLPAFPLPSLVAPTNHDALSIFPDGTAPPRSPPMDSGSSTPGKFLIVECPSAHPKGSFEDTAAHMYSSAPTDTATSVAWTESGHLLGSDEFPAAPPLTKQFPRPRPTTPTMMTASKMIPHRHFLIPPWSHHTHPSCAAINN
jgi:hypothetical protein